MSKTTVNKRDPGYRAFLIFRTLAQFKPARKKTELPLAKINLSNALAFFYISLHEGLTQQELMEALDVDQSAVSRWAAALSSNVHRDANQVEREGLGLIETRTAGSNRKELHHYLSPSGKRLLDEVSDLIEKG